MLISQTQLVSDYSNSPPQNTAELTVDKGNLQEIVLRKGLYRVVYFQLPKESNTRMA